jgi:hypothetical protein
MKIAGAARFARVLREPVQFKTAARSGGHVLASSLHPRDGFFS